MRNKRNNSKFKEMFFSHINNNKREYFIIIILFCIGIVLGILFINNVNDIQKDEIIYNKFLSKEKVCRYVCYWNANCIWYNCI